MLVHSSLHHHNHSLCSTLSYSRPLPCKIPHLAFRLPVFSQNLPGVACSISQIHSYGTVDYERRPMLKWGAIYKRISLMEKPELGAETVLNRCEKEGKKLTKWELCRVVKELRKFRRHDQALQVYEWMNNRGERFRQSASDAAIQLDLISKVHGVSQAEDFFLKLPDTLKDRRIYGALLNAYVQARMKEKAESLVDRMREKGYVSHALPFNVMMTLYMNLKEYGKVDKLVSEMMEKNIQLDIYTYNIWLSSRGSEGSAERMEEVFEKMKLDKTINANWTTYSTMTAMYIKMGQLEKAEECLRKVESRISGRDRMPYHYLLSLYGQVGKKEEVHRVWKIYKSVFPTIPNLGYHAVIASLLRVGDVEGAEKIYSEWLPVKSSYDPRIGNLLMAWYVREGKLDKAESFYEQMIQLGGKPNASTWEILAEGHMREKRVPEVLSCWKEAFSAEGSKSWRPKPVNLMSFFKLCDEEADAASKEEVMRLLMQSGFLEDEAYAALVDLNGVPLTGNDLSSGENEVHSGIEHDDLSKHDGSGMLVNEYDGSL